MKLTVLLALLIVLGGCTIGPQVQNEPLAREPRGASVTLQARGHTITGELLEVQDSALLVLTPEERVTLVSYRLLRRGDAEMRIPIVRGGEPPSRARREQLRRVSRFPQGLDPSLRGALLDAYGQADVVVFQP
jgi:hypothetical protein